MNADQDCLTTSGFCFGRSGSARLYPVNPNRDWLDFEKSTYSTLNSSNMGIGRGDAKSLNGGGGRITIGCDTLYVYNKSEISSNSYQQKYTNLQPNIKVRSVDSDPPRDKSIIVNGTGGYVYILVNDLFFKDAKSNCIQALGSQFLEKNNVVFTSSSGGSILVKYKDLRVVHAKQVVQVDLEYFLQVNQVKDVFSSAGLIYVSNRTGNSFLFKHQGKVMHKSEAVSPQLTPQTPSQTESLIQVSKSARNYFSAKPVFKKFTNWSVEMLRPVAVKVSTFVKQQRLSVSKFNLVLDPVIQIRDIDFQSISVEISFYADFAITDRHSIKYLKVQKSSMVTLVFPELFTVHSLSIRNASLTVMNKRFFLVTTLLLVENSDFSVNR